MTRTVSITFDATAGSAQFRKDLEAGLRAAGFELRSAAHASREETAQWVESLPLETSDLREVIVPISYTVEILEFTRADDGCRVAIELAEDNLIPGFLERITSADDFRRWGAFVDIHGFDRIADGDALLEILRPFNGQI